MDAPTSPAWIPAAECDRWRSDVQAWISVVLAGLGMRSAGPPAVHKLAPWSMVLKLPTPTGPVWFKASVPKLAPEPALLSLLTQLVPGQVPAPLGTEPTRGWLLLADHGPTLRARGRDGDPALWADLVSQWSGVTRTLAAHADALELVGVPRLAPQDAVGYLHQRIGQLASLPAPDPARLTEPEADQLTGACGSVARAAEQLGALGLPNTLWHNDLHTDNVFDTEAGLVFFDLGDALLGSPLSELLIPLRSHARARGFELALDDDVFADRGLERIVEAGIEPWTDLAPAPALRAAVPAALLLGGLGRSEGWRRAVGSTGAGVAPDYAAASTAWLLHLVGRAARGRAL